MEPLGRKIESNKASLVTELTKSTKDKIAGLIEERAKEHWLVPTVDGFVYGTTRALDFGDYYGELGKKFGNNKKDWEWAINKNADYFEYTQLIKTNESGIPSYLSFRKASMHLNHNSHDPQLAIGLVFDATLMLDKYGDTNVVILFGIDRMKAAGIARQLETYPERVFTSMGCSIKSSMCTVCEKQIFKDSDFCDCLRYHRGQRLKGKKVAELLIYPNFYEQSVVSVPACANARVLDAVSEIIPGRILKVASQELDGEGDAIIRVMASIYQSIKVASTMQEKKALSFRLDMLIDKLEGMF
jgi:hypothetical protein